MVTNKSPCGPNRGYSHVQHLWFTERVIDIVANELGLDPVEVRKKNYVRAEEMPYETPNGCVYDSGDYARCLDIALELVDYDGIEERRRDAESRGRLLGVGIGSTLDSGTNNWAVAAINPELQFSGNNEVASVKLDIFGEVVVTLGTTPRGRGTRRPQRRWWPTSSAARPTTSPSAPATTPTGTHAGFSGRTRASSPSPGSAR